MLFKLKNIDLDEKSQEVKKLAKKVFRLEEEIYEMSQKMRND